MKLLSWNLAGRSKTDLQVEAVHSCSPDLFAGQELTKTSLPKLREGLKSLGFGHIIDSFSLAPDHQLLVGHRKYGQIIASRYRLQVLPPLDFPVPWPERVLSGVVDIEGQPVELHTTHIPPGRGNGWIKIQTFEGIYRRLKKPGSRPRILCGDFNSPHIELPDGRVKCFGEHLRADGSIVPVRHKGQPYGRWCNAERSVILGLAKFDLPDVFRMLHDYEVQEASLRLRRKGKLFSRRIDHIFASRKLKPISCQYLHYFRNQGLSDHSPIIAEFLMS